MYIPKSSLSLNSTSIAAANQRKNVIPNKNSMIISPQFHNSLKKRRGPCITHMRIADQVYPKT